MATKRLFDNDAYRMEFDGEVVEVRINNGKTEVILDQTLFFPEQGGQTPDKGVLAGHEVIDVQVDKSDVITHTLAGICDIAPGQRVEGVIDFNHRYANMQQHSGEHVFSGICNAKYGYDNVGFHLSDHVVTIDTSGPLTDEQVKELELLTNKAIMENHPVKTYYPSEAELEKINYRCKSGIKGDIRIVEIEGVDICACCAPHVRSTGEIGIFKVMDAVKYKGGTRITILCGYRALEAFCDALALQKDICQRLSSSPSELAGNIDRLKNEVGNLKGEIAKGQAALLATELQKIDADAENVMIFLGELDNKVMRDAVNELVAGHDGFCGIFAGDRFIVGSKSRDCNEAAVILRGMGIKCGGSAAMIQGSADMTTISADDIRKALGV